MERYPYKQAAIFSDEQAAFNAEKKINSLNLSGIKVFVLSPDIEKDEKKLEPENDKIRNSFIRNAVVGAVAGIFVGVIIFLILKSINPDFFIENPALADITGLSLVGSFIGAIVGVLFGAKVKEDMFMGTLQDALKQGKWGLIIHSGSKEANEKLKEILQGINHFEKILHN